MSDPTPDDVIIMVDDDENDTYVARVCFEKSSLRNAWLTFHDGPAFLEHLGKVKAGVAGMPTAVLLDINMPGMNGFEVLSRVREDRFFEERPRFIVLTTSDEGLDREKAGALGASRFVTKPDSMAEYVRFFDSLVAADTGGSADPGSTSGAARD